MADHGVVDQLSEGLLIGGQWRPASGGATFAVENPATGEELAQVSDATGDDATAALDAAALAQADWAATPPSDRAEILRRAYELLVEHSDELAELITLEMGKSLADAAGEVTYAAEFFRWFAGEATRISGRWSTAPNGASRLLTMKQPVGPTYMVTPWNFPLAMGTRKIGPALAAGCTMVIKPAELTPLTMIRLAEILIEAGLPDGVLNLVTTSDAAAVSAPLMSDRRLRKITFTGSTGVGRTLVEQSAERLLRTSMELGGNAPFVVFDDADLDAAVAGAMVAKMRNIGQACTAANRFLVAESVVEEFTDKLVEAMEAQKVGAGWEEGVQVGPLISAKALDAVAGLVDGAVKSGATVRCGGKRLDRPGHFYAPTVLTDVPADDPVATTEIFGPVAPITTFSDEAEAVAAANATDYGLVAYAWTKDLNRALRMSERLEFGMVGLNTGLVSNAAAPFGGVKDSGFGREGGFEGIDEYLSVKYVGIADPGEA
ncbi:NAD-dependent succinate-semialdehyde dehydrogenase [Propionibacteriaceae bacterium Y1685]|uniref:NAD-dependent succinate-semialdehyde dehydrogenase n=1 Tax=Microlunatus sp. Y1700 TaxID=3418487 RepID=UPI003B7C35FB